MTRKQYSPKFKAKVAVEAIRGERTLGGNSGRSEIKSESPRIYPALASMSRESRLVEPGVTFHVTARGTIARMSFSAEDRASYLTLLSQRAGQEGLELLGCV